MQSVAATQQQRWGPLTARRKAAHHTAAIIPVCIPSRRQLTVCAAAKQAKQQQQKQQKVEYGSNWYEQTRAASKPKRTVREEIAFRKAANAAANNGRERKDLYTDNWDGSEYKGSSFNILTLLAVLFLAVPVAGLVFAYETYGVLWG